ncbi:MAG: hypothetical protein U1F43_31520 [Myxococcota bacterium]
MSPPAPFPYSFEQMVAASPARRRSGPLTATWWPGTPCDQTF